MYIVSEFTVCVVLIFAVAALLFAASATFFLIQEVPVAARRIVRNIRERWRQPAPLSVGKAMKQEG